MQQRWGSGGSATHNRKWTLYVLLGGLPAVVILLTLLQRQIGKQDAGGPVGHGGEGRASRLDAVPSVANFESIRDQLKALVSSKSKGGDSQGKDGAGTLCDMLPPVIELPLSELALTEDTTADAGGGGALARFTLVPDIPVTTKDGKHSYAAYVYAENDVVSGHLQKEKYWEAGYIVNVLDQLHQFAKDNNLRSDEVYLVDIGANVGTFSFSAAAHGFKVIAIEAMFSNIAALKLSLCANEGFEDRVTVVGKGLGREPTTCTLFSLGDNMGDGTMRCGKDLQDPPGGIKRATMEVVRLDDELRPDFGRLKGRVGAVKMDIEGAEALAVEGGLEFFREVAPPFLMAECDGPMILAATGKPAGNFLTQMADLGYRVYVGSMQEVPRDQLAGYSSCSYTQVFFKKG